MNRFYLLLCFCMISFVKAGFHQKRLLDKLMSNYNPLERPVKHENETLAVSIGLAFQQIVDIDEKKQILVFSGWLDMSWRDYNLQWDPEEYGNITIIRISSSRVWTPDLILYNSADDSFDIITSKVNVVIMNTGEVSYLPPGMFKSTCPIKIDDFPFDEQNCSLKFGSWSNDDASVSLTNKSDRAQLDSYIKNGEWLLLDVTSYAESIVYECCPQKFPFVMFVIHLRRRTLYFVFNLIFPCVLISFLSVLGFSLPPDSGEKIGLEVAVLLSIIMFSQVITGIIPESSLSVPKIALYFACVMVISGMSIICNVLVLIFHHKNVKIQQPLPKWVELVVCNYMASILGMKKPGKEDNSKKNPSKKLLALNLANSTNDLNELSSRSLLANVLDINDDFGVIGNRNYFNRKSRSKVLNEQQPNNQIFLKRENSSLSQALSENPNDSLYISNSSSHANKSEISILKKSLGVIIKELRVITQKLKDDEEDEGKSLDWKFAAMVIDRLCMILFAIATLLSAIVVLFTSKTFFMPSDPSPIF